MKLSISNIAWAVESDDEIHTLLKESGYRGLEIAPTRIIPEKPYENVPLAVEFSNNLKNRYGLAISSMQSILFGVNERLFASEEERAILVEYTKKAIDFAKAISCRNLVFGSPKNRVIDNMNQYPHAIDFFRELGDYAWNNNTVLSIEPNPPIYNTNFINRTQEAFNIVKEVDLPGFKVNVDFGTIIENGESVDMIAKNIEYVNHIHISEPYLNPIVDRELHATFASVLKKSGYGGYVSIEMKNTGDVLAVKKAVKYVKDVFNND